MNIFEFLASQGDTIFNVNNISTNELIANKNEREGDAIGSHTLTTTRTVSEDNGNQKIVTTIYTITFASFCERMGIECSRYLEPDPRPELKSESSEIDFILTKTKVTTIVRQTEVCTHAKTITHHDSHEHKAEQKVKILQNESGELEIELISA